MASEPLFQARTRKWLIVVGVASFMAAVVAGLFGDKLGEVTSIQPNTYSMSSLGHSLLVSFLERTGTEVVVSRYQSAARANQTSVLLLAEPSLSEDRVRREPWMRDGILKPAGTLVVLPKWTGSERHLENARWVGDAKPEDLEEIQEVLEFTCETLEFEETEAFVTRLEEQQEPVWLLNEFGVIPTVAGPLQLMAEMPGRPLIACEEGVLLSELQRLDGNLVWILSDPDVISNHGLPRGENIDLAAQLFQLINPYNATLFVDETLHGLARRPEVFRAIFRPPLLFITLQILLATVVLIWAGLRRFGTPLPPPPPLVAGKASLLNNTSQLLQLGGHNAQTVRRYYHVTLEDAMNALHIPRRQNFAERRDLLQQLCEQRGIRVNLPQLARSIHALHDGGPNKPLLQAAQQVHRLREELLHGS